MIRRLFRRQKSRPLTEAELAHRLIDPGYACTCCGEVLNAAAGAVWPTAPFGWTNPPAPYPDDAFDTAGRDVLTENYARRGGDTLLRAYLPIPVQGTETQVFLGVWCSLKVGNHARFRSAQARGDADRMGDMFSWLYTQLPAMTGPLLTEGVLTPYSQGRLPLYWITAEKHPLYRAQQDGLTASEILALYRDMGCGDLVDHLIA
ncbi:DUF2199 domain-containing protein [Gymnodinialimonas sp. 2305UL16-5]|uniref:DUF2199 domain-containing protein n=1 Tax=Gymnodinialimonas mytili TaxID=3126503 RepID=UPI00309C8BF0